MAIIKTLAQIATVRTVMLFRDRAPRYAHPGTGNASVVAIKDLVGKWPVDFNMLPTTLVEPNMLSHRIKPGEILMPARGDYYPARYIPPSSGHNLFPAGQIYVITPDSSIRPVYMAWYINSHDVQTKIRSSLTGTNIQSLNKSKLLALPISVPSWEIQNEISRIQEMQLERVALMQEMILLKHKEVEAGCLKLLRRGD